MFEGIQEKLEKTFRWITGYGRLSPRNIEDALQELRVSLLEADVHHKVVDDLLSSVKTKSLGREVMESITPGQQFIKIFRDEITALLGEPSELNLSGRPPIVIMLVGLQGSGKTTTAAKLAKLLKERNKRHPCLAASDLKRPAAVEQLKVLGESLGIPCLSPREKDDVLSFVSTIKKEASSIGCDTVALDTAGRLHTDREMMDELKEIKARVMPNETLLILDAMAGQDAVRVAEEFLSGIGFDAAILTKADGDARGGAALSLRAVTGRPIRFLGVGEKLNALEPFNPERMASRIIGMGDVLTLVEKAEAQIQEKEKIRAREIVRKGELDLNDFLDQLKALKRMGSMDDLLSLIPGASKIMLDQSRVKAAEEDIGKSEAIISSMTLKERAHPEILNGSRRLRVARGSGTTVQDVNKLIKKFTQAKKLMKTMSRMGLRGLGGNLYGS